MASASITPAVLVGRSAELALLDRHFDSAPACGGALMLTGEAGVGKSALLDTAAPRAAGAGFRVLRVAGCPFQQGVGFSALNQLLQPLADAIPALPARQAETLQAVRGLSEEQPTELLAIANAVQALVAQVATEAAPLALIVDDVAWVDRSSATVLGTLAHSPRTGHLTVLGASRTGDVSFLSNIGIPEHEVRPLDDVSADELVAGRFPAMAARVRRRLVAEARGNPLALLELPVPLNDLQHTARSTLPAVLQLTERLKGIFSTRVAALPAPTRKLLLLAVLDASGELHVLQRALGGADPLAGLSPAERA
ncbi:ATP-binding protein, partial [Streptomyces sp. W16]|uniref:ATP-binding protein n=1 Tax=Streptomyces sp. W16 TaxID=3076631 RepID=UPI00295A7D8E